MKTILTQVMAFLIMTISFAQTGINYKAVIKDGSGNIVAGQNIGVQFTILEDAVATYVENHTLSSTDANGIIILNIGLGSPTTGTFGAIDWSKTTTLKTGIDIDGGLDNLVDMGTTQFMAVPYALSSADAITKLDDLSDGKADTDGSSLFVGIDAGLNDDGTANQNVGVGSHTLAENTIGYWNTATGYYALSANTTGIYNTANGTSALLNNTTGGGNNAIGVEALFSNTTGYWNTANGAEALRSNTEGYMNTANGVKALYTNTEGFLNTANGVKALYSNTTGAGNNANGAEALYTNTTGYNNTADGYRALFSNTTANNNTANGVEALFSNTDGYSNTANGSLALYSNITGNNNTANGDSALISNTTGNFNTALGNNAGHNINGSNNTFIGQNAGSGTSLRSLSESVFIGSNAGYNETNSNRLYIENSSSTTPLIYGEFDTDLLRINGTLDINDAYQFPNTDGASGQILQTDGAGTLSWEIPIVSSGLEQITENNGSYNNTGWRLIGINPNSYGSIGNGAVDLSITGINSSTRGATGATSVAMGEATTASGYGSFAMGRGAEALGPSSTAMGYYTIASGSSSTAMGSETTASGSYSTSLGRGTKAPSILETVIGQYNKDYTLGTGGNVLWNPTDRLFVIGNGTGSTEALRSNALTVLKNGNVGIGNDTPASVLEVTHPDGYPTVGNVTNAFSIRNASTSASWQFNVDAAGALGLYSNGSPKGYFNVSSGAYIQTSDRRVKKDIHPLESGTLNKLLELRPVSYLMKDQEDSNINFGLISQEVQQVYPNLTHEYNGKDLLVLSYTELIPVLIKAIQEQQEIIDEQSSTLKSQDSKINGLTAELDQKDQESHEFDQRLKQIETLLKTLN